jgi:hypothetical protein
LWHIRGRGEVHTGFGLGNLKEWDYFEAWYKWKDNIKMNLKEMGW